MLRKILLPSILIILGYGFWVSPDFKEIAAGVSIFLFGMLFLEEGFKAFTGGVLEKLLQKTTNKTWKSLLFGVVSTTIMQSSSLVSVITISFISAGLVTLVAGIGIIFGANIGTTTGAWLVAAFGLKVKISAYAMPMLVFGIVLSFQKSKYLKGIGSAGGARLPVSRHTLHEGRLRSLQGQFRPGLVGRRRISRVIPVRGHRCGCNRRHAVQPCDAGVDSDRAGRRPDYL